MNTVEVQSLQKEYLLPPTKPTQLRRKRGRPRRKRLPPVGERDSYRTSTVDLSLNIEMLSEESSCPDVDEDTCWGTEDQDERAATGTSDIPRTPTSRSLGC